MIRLLLLTRLQYYDHRSFPLRVRRGWQRLSLYQTLLLFIRQRPPTYQTGKSLAKAASQENDGPAHLKCPSKRLRQVEEQQLSFGLMAMRKFLYEKG